MNSTTVWTGAPIQNSNRNGCMSEHPTPSVNLPRVIVPKRHVDDRGWFSEIFHEKRLYELGITCRFVQDNQAISIWAGTLRGLHFQVPPAAQAKLIRVVRGRILDVAVDVRRDSPTFGRHVSTDFRPTRAVSFTFLWVLHMDM